MAFIPLIWRIRPMAFPVVQKTKSASSGSSAIQTKEKAGTQNGSLPVKKFPKGTLLSVPPDPAVGIATPRVAVCVGFTTRPPNNCIQSSHRILYLPKCLVPPADAGLVPLHMVIRVRILTRPVFVAVYTSAAMFVGVGYR
ncbi:hypothetical protein C6501_03985, partial [Candidatus Poribacteria bacterium]